MSKVAIIMSTYNGHEYIKEQIASILSQAYTDFTLFIRDDGSTDDTVLILQSLAITDSRIKLIIDEDKIAQSMKYSQMLRHNSL